MAEDVQPKLLLLFSLRRRFNLPFLLSTCFVLLALCSSLTFKSTIRLDSADPCFVADSNAAQRCDSKPSYDAGSPLVNCSYLPEAYLDCEEPREVPSNASAADSYGCHTWGGERYEEVEKTMVKCTALDGIECFGNRTFFKTDIPCIKYSGHHFLSTLLYSVLLGFLGVDRFCLRQTGTAIGKLLTLGGIGVWWIVDVILLITGNLTPDDQSNWVPYY